VIGPDDVREAARVLDGVAHRTPVLSSAALDGMVGAHVVLKAECFQRAGAFKFRGAYNKVSSLDLAQRGRGVVAYSSGNHGQGVGLAARLLGAPATIVMPSDAPASKVEATRGYGAQVVVYDRFTEDREAIGAALAEERGLALVKPYDDPLIMAGQGTAALELLDDAGGFDVFVAPVGGGGLMAGCATVVRDRCPDARIVGVEPEAGDDYKRSLEAGRRITIEVPRTIADGQQLTTPGELTFEVNRRLVDEIVTVSDGQIVDAMGLLFERLKVVAEPSGACALAALLAGKIDVPAGARVGVILSGGNVSAARFAELLRG
jgi:threo-3-hydroxy-L-aspartate ammonia-lyase